MTHSAEAEAFLASLPDGAGSLNRKLGIELVELSVDRVVATMPVEGNTQPVFILHGGASVSLAEAVGSFGAGLHAFALGKAAVGVDINATHHRGAAPGETVTAVGTPAHLGRTSATYDVVISNEAGKRVCTSRITCALIDLR